MINALLSFVVYLPTTLTASTAINPSLDILYDLALVIGMLMSLTVIQYIVRLMLKAKSGLFPKI